MKHIGLLILIFTVFTGFPVFGNIDNVELNKRLPSEQTYEEIGNSYSLGAAELPTLRSDEPEGPPIAGGIPIEDLKIEYIVLFGLVYLLIRKKRSFIPKT